MIATVLELSIALDERDASIQIHNGPMEWTVCLYAPEDAGAAWFRVSDSELWKAITRAFDAWDGKEADQP